MCACVCVYTNRCRWFYFIENISKCGIVFSKICIFLKLNRNCQIIFPKRLKFFTCQSAMNENILLFAFLPQIDFTVLFKIFASFMDIKRYLAFTSIWISMVTKEIWSLFTLAIWICSSVNCLSYPFFLLGYLTFLL